METGRTVEKPQLSNRVPPCVKEHDPEKTQKGGQLRKVETDLHACVDLTTFVVSEHALPFPTARLCWSALTERRRSMVVRVTTVGSVRHASSFFFLIRYFSPNFAAIDFT